MPSDPLSTPASSERMSPNRFSVSTTSKLVGSVTMRMAQESTYMCSSFTSGIFFAEQRDDLTPELRGFEDVRLVDDVTFLRRLRASSKATRPTRSISSTE